MEFRKMAMMTLYARQEKRHRCVKQNSTSIIWLSNKNQNKTNQHSPPTHTAERNAAWPVCRETENYAILPVGMQNSGVTVPKTLQKNQTVTIWPSKSIFKRCKEMQKIRKQKVRWNSLTHNVGNYSNVSQFWFPRCVCPAVGLLGHKGVLFAIF